MLLWENEWRRYRGDCAGVSEERPSAPQAVMVAKAASTGLSALAEIAEFAVEVVASVASVVSESALEVATSVAQEQLAYCYSASWMGLR